MIPHLGYDYSRVAVWRVRDHDFNVHLRALGVPRGGEAGWLDRRSPSSKPDARKRQASGGHHKINTRVLTF